MGNKRIVIGCDHAGYPLKAELLKHLSARGIEYTDIGCDSAEKSVDYPKYADKLCRELQAGNADLGILVCGTGIGMMHRRKQAQRHTRRMCQRYFLRTPDTLP